jgi:hypothetical protein
MRLPFVAKLLNFDLNGRKRGSNGFFERLVLFAGRHCAPSREGDHDKGLGHIGLFLVMGIFRQGDASMEEIVMPSLEIRHAGFNFLFPPLGHTDVAALDL